MEYLIVAIAVVVAAFMFRNALKDVFDVFKIFGRLGTFLWRLVTPNRALSLGTKNRSAIVQQLLDAESADNQADYGALVATVNSDTIAEYVHTGVGVAAERYGQQNTTSIRAQILYAAHLVDAANQARGGATADRTDGAELANFAVLNEQAQDVLNAALKLTLADAELSEQANYHLTIYQLLLRTHRGAGDKAGAYSTHEAALASAPGRLDGQVDMLNLMSQRWLGEAGESLTLAERIEAFDTHNPGIVPASHIEHWMDLDGDESDLYFQQPDLVARLESCYSQLPQRVDSDHWVPGHQQALALNAFALCFSLAEKKTLARTAFSRIGDDYTPFPWKYLGAEPQKAFLKARDSSSF